jgi:guanylate kinase
MNVIKEKKKKMYKILAICGEAGTGKDTLFQHSLLDQYEKEKRKA